MLDRTSSNGVASTNTFVRSFALGSISARGADLPSPSAVQIGTVRTSQPLTHTFEEVFGGMRSPAEANAARAERQILDADLRKRFGNGEIHPLAYYRALMRISQGQLANLAGSRQTFISNIERGVRPLTWKQAIKFAESLGVSPEQLMQKKY